MTEGIFNPTAAPARHHVVVVGGGFGGIEAVKRLARAPLDVTLVDRRNFHLFQPLTYQVATGALSQGEVAFSLRALFHRAKNVRVMLAEVTGFDLEAREVRLDSAAGAHTPDTLGYDSLIVAGGSTYSYFGHDEWSGIAPEVKSLESALETRSRILNAFEKAELEPDPEARRAQLTFVVVGAGPTGVEMAGQIGEMARDTLRHDFRAIDPRQARIVLVEAGERVLSTFPPSLSVKAERALAQLGVTTMLRTAVVGIDPDGVTLQREDNSEYLPARTVIWAAGVRASALAGELASAAGAEQDRAGRVTVESDLTLQGHPEVIALGDMVRVRGRDGEAQQLPGVAPAAIQQGRYAGRLMANRVRGRKTPPFHYRDKGNLATIGRARAVADLHFVRVNGPLAWLLWLGVHIFYLIGFQNRLLVLLRWGFSFVTRGRGAQLITGAEAHRH
jgi:NADH dehydrogenase